MFVYIINTFDFSVWKMFKLIFYQILKNRTTLMRLSRNCFNVMPKWTLFSYPRAPAQQVPDGLMCYFCLKSIAEFDKKVNHVLETFCDYFESLPDQFPTLPPDFDVFLQDGVLTMNLGGSYGTYVINKQTASRQIWVASPYSGPQYYNFVNGQWVDSKDGGVLSDKLAEELGMVFRGTLENFPQFTYD
ncbi:Frataxin -like protein, mitochondrial [Trichinella pseudospiralis]|uniref:Frataxin-like protein, mitochondrial n=1 Tax=Trichinella pseudospiralis TaxID=6337 RepID=A0A0V1J5F4_TRIPS|nr:Frataxin -like protein, mitochondrial [Trichinella pseudospiralis]